MAYNITLIPGDGVGPEITEATRRVLEATGVKFNWELAYAGAEVMAKQGTPLPDSVLASIKKEQSGAQRAGDHADRDGLPKRQRRPA